MPRVSLSLEAFAPAAYAVRRAEIEALERRGWALRATADGYVAELDDRLAAWGETLENLLHRIRQLEKETHDE